MADLKTNYQDDVLNTSKNSKRKYNMITNPDGTVSFEDVTEYSQVGDSFGALQVNEIGAAINSLNQSLEVINEKTTDSGWQILNSTYNVNYRKINGIVFVKINTNTKINDGTTLGTLPTGYRPTEWVHCRNYSGDSALSVEKTGIVKWATTSTYNHLILSYPADA